MTILMSLVLMAAGASGAANPQSKIGIEVSAQTVGKYQKAELLIRVDKQYGNPFDPDEVDLAVVIATPGGREMVLPAFFCQDYERQKLSQGRSRGNWYYPVGAGAWKARFAPMETGGYSAKARLKDPNGTIESQAVRFECVPSQSKGFIRTGRKDPRFFEFTEGDPFFVIGQNLAFIGEGQYVNLTKAEEIFGRLSENGANFLRIWTCCEDWAMAIEARKSAWGRSWGGKGPIVPVPGSEAAANPRKCVKIEGGPGPGGEGASISVSPSHEVAVRPNTRYVLSGRFMAEGPTGLKVQLSHADANPRFDAAPEGQWKEFRYEFVTGQNALWLGRLAVGLTGASGKVWLDNLSLKEASGGAELLWEADVNRSVRGYYNQVDCFILDELINAAERNGIYLMLCAITRDLYMNSLSDAKSAEYQQAIDDGKKFMRYAVARWGYSTSVAAWEYFNEMDPGKPTDRFYDEVGRYLEEVDIYHHLRTTSTWHPSARDCRHARIDIGQLHHYMRPETKEEFKDEVAVLIDKTRFLREHGPNKPVLIGEFGLATEKWGLSENMKQDKEGAHFHTSLWASAFAGGSGTAMFWWWDQLDRQDAYAHYKPLATFLKNVSFAGLNPARAIVSKGQLRVLGYQGGDRAYIWLFNPQATWWNLVMEKQQPAEIKNVVVEIEGLTPGGYAVEWWDTFEGKTIASEQVSFTQGALRIPVRAFSRDVACKIKLISSH